MDAHQIQKKDLPENKINIQSQLYLNQQKCNKKPNKSMYLQEPVYFNCNLMSVTNF